MAESFERGLFEAGRIQTVFTAEDALRDINDSLKGREGDRTPEVRELLASQAFFNGIIEREEEAA